MSRLLNWQSWVALVFCSGFLCCSLVLTCSWSYKCVQHVWATRTGLRILRLVISRDSIWIWTVVGVFREEKQRKNQYFLFYKQIIPSLVMPQLQKWQWKLQKSKHFRKHLSIWKCWLTLFPSASKNETQTWLNQVLNFCIPTLLKKVFLISPEWGE